MTDPGPYGQVTWGVSLSGRSACQALMVGCGSSDFLLSGMDQQVQPWAAVAHFFLHLSWGLAVVA